MPGDMVRNLSGSGFSSECLVGLAPRPHLIKKRPLDELTFTERFWVCAVLCALALLTPTTLCGRYDHCP